MERLAAEKKAEEERLAAEQAEKERLAAEQAEEERIAAEKKAEEERLAAEKLAAEKKAEEERLAAEKKAEEERIAAEQAVMERLAAEKKAEEERLAAEKKAEEERLAAEQAVMERLAAEKKAEEERIAAEKKAEEERLAAEQAEVERIAAEKKAEEERLAAIQAAAEKAVLERLAAEKKAEEERLAAKKKAEEERIAAEQAEVERIAAEKKAEEEKIAAEQAVLERLAAEKKAEEERIVAEKLAAEKKAEEERIAAEKKAEEERLAAEKLAVEKKAEEERIAAEKLAAEKKAEEERIAAEKKAEEERNAAEKKAEEERIAAEKLAAEKKAEQERIAAEKKAEEERIAAEKLAAEKKAEEERIAAVSVEGHSDDDSDDTDGDVQEFDFDINGEATIEEGSNEESDEESDQVVPLSPAKRNNSIDDNTKREELLVRAFTSLGTKEEPNVAVLLDTLHHQEESYDAEVEHALDPSVLLNIVKNDEEDHDDALDDASKASGDDDEEDDEEEVVEEYDEESSSKSEKKTLESEAKVTSNKFCDLIFKVKFWDLTLDDFGDDQFDQFEDGLSACLEVDKEHMECEPLDGPHCLLVKVHIFDLQDMAEAEEVSQIATEAAENDELVDIEEFGECVVCDISFEEHEEEVEEEEESDSDTKSKKEITEMAKALLEESSDASDDEESASTDKDLTSLATKDGSSNQKSLSFKTLSSGSLLDENNVSFSATLSDLSLEDFTLAKQSDFKKVTAKELAVKPTQVNITGIRAGSVLVDVEVKDVSSTLANTIVAKASKSSFTSALSDAGLGSCLVSKPIISAGKPLSPNLPPPDIIFQKDGGNSSPLKDEENVGLKQASLDWSCLNVTDHFKQVTNYFKEGVEAKEWGKTVGNEEGIRVWQITSHFQPISWPKHMFGQFYDGNAYVVLHSEILSNVHDRDGEDSKLSAAERTKLVHDVHVWIGHEISQSEYIAAITLSQELVKVLSKLKNTAERSSGVSSKYNSARVQLHREIMDHESLQFLSYFAPPLCRAMTISHGKYSTASNDNGVKLYRVRNRRNGVCFQLRQIPLEKTSLCGQGSYLLEFRNADEKKATNLKEVKIWTWFGPRANLEEKRFTATMASWIKSEHVAQKRVVKESDVCLVEMKHTAPYVTFKDQPEFWNFLKGDEVNIDEDIEGEDEDGVSLVGKVGSLAWSEGCFGEGKCWSASDLRAAWDGLEEGEMREGNGVAKVKLTKPLLYVLRTNDSSKSAETGKCFQYMGAANVSGGSDGKLLSTSWTSDVILIDGGYKLFVWIGKEVSASPLDEVRALAVVYAEKHQRLNHGKLCLPITLLEQGNEVSEFKKCFKTYDKEEANVASGSDGSLTEEEEEHHELTDEDNEQPSIEEIQERDLQRMSSPRREELSEVEEEEVQEEEGEEVEEIAVEFTITLLDLAPEDFDEEYEDRYLSDLSECLGIKKEQIEFEIMDDDGAVCLPTTLTGFADEGEAEWVAKDLESAAKSGDLLALDEYGELTLTDLIILMPPEEDEEEEEGEEEEEDEHSEEDDDKDGKNGGKRGSKGDEHEAEYDDEQEYDDDEDYGEDEIEDFDDAGEQGFEHIVTVLEDVIEEGDEDAEDTEDEEEEAAAPAPSSSASKITSLFEKHDSTKNEKEVEKITPTAPVVAASQLKSPEASSSVVRPPSAPKDSTMIRPPLGGPPVGGGRGPPPSRFGGSPSPNKESTTKPLTSLPPSDQKKKKKNRSKKNKKEVDDVEAVADSLFAFAAEEMAGKDEDDDTDDEEEGVVESLDFDDLLGGEEDSSTIPIEPSKEKEELEEKQEEEVIGKGKMQVVVMILGKNRSLTVCCEPTETISEFKKKLLDKLKFKPGVTTKLVYGGTGIKLQGMKTLGSYGIQHRTGLQLEVFNDDEEEVSCSLNEEKTLENSSESDEEEENFQARNNLASMNQGNSRVVSQSLSRPSPGGFDEDDRLTRSVDRVNSDVKSSSNKPNHSFGSTVDVAVAKNEKKKGLKGMVKTAMFGFKSK